MDSKEINLQLRKKVGEKIQLIRKDESYEKIASRCNLDASKISKIEKGRIDFRINTIFEIAKGLRVHPKELLDIKFSFEDYYKEIDHTYRSTK
jgi:transcriptional regulator with XRE-family HTH domain